MSSESIEDKGVKRRAFLHGAVHALMGVWAVFAAGGVGYTGMKYLWPSHDTNKSGGKQKIDINISEIPKGGMLKIKFKGGPVGIIELNGVYHALSIVCTHLGCLVTMDPKKSDRLYCPCHGSVFDLNGNVQGGPAPSPLASYPVKVLNDKIVIG